MQEFTIKLNQTSKDEFCEWLNVYTKKIGGVNSPDYPYMGGAIYRIHYYEVYQVKEVKFSAQIRQPAPPDQTPPLDTISIWDVHDPEEGVTYRFWAWELDNVLNLSWYKVEGGLKVTIKHADAKWIISPVFQLLAAIKADYPSAGDSINKYIVEQADW